MRISQLTSHRAEIEVSAELHSAFSGDTEQYLYTSLFCQFVPGLTGSTAQPT